MKLFPLPLNGPNATIAKGWLAAACERPGCDLTTDDLMRACAQHEAQLVGIFEDEPPSERGGLVAAGVVQVRDYADGVRSCWVLAVGGSGARAWRHTLREIEAGAAGLGCATVEFVGRPGWARLLPDYAAEPCEAGTHYAKRLR